MRIGLLLLFALMFAGCGRKAPPPAPPPEVLVTNVRQADVPIYAEYVGTLEASVNASIQARVAGYLISQNYEEGRVVKKGDLLFQIDPVPFESAKAEAKAALAQAQAQAKQAEMTAQRNTALFERRAISEQDRDNAVLQASAAAAVVDAQRAALRQAELNLGYASIRSPIDGIAGFARAQVGDLVGPTTGVLTSVSTVDPIKAYFTVSDQQYVAYTQRWSGNPEGRAEHERQFEFELILANGSIFPEKGRLFAVGNDVDVRTGAQRIATLFPNPENSLRGGQFARIRQRREVRKDALLVPQRAVTEVQGTFHVAVIGPDNTAEIRFVKPGPRVGQEWIIEEGLQPGERIVVEGIQKARAGVTVHPSPWNPPAAAAASPTPNP